MEPEIVRRADGCHARKAIASDGTEYTYGELLHASAACAGAVASELARGDGNSVAFLVAPGFDHVAWQWGIWRAGAVAVPLSAAQAPAEWDFIIEDAQAGVVIGDDQAGALAAIAARHGARWISALGTPHSALGTPHLALGTPHLALGTPHSALGIPHSALGTPHLALGTPHLALSTQHPALLLYTSGTTSRPKGVVLTHANLEAQMATLAGAWGWRSDDRVLHVLPLNHVHGIVNVLGCALWSGACCEFLSPFDAARAWERLAAGGITLFMAVPTIYAKLLAAFDAADGTTRERWAAGSRGLRLMVSGSAALPVTVLERWCEVTGHVLLERYGMTEIGMALSNPLHGPRRPGCVGVPLPGVDVRLVDEVGALVPNGVPGEIEVRGPGVFAGYWRRPDATLDAFRDGWFRTGDVAVVEDGVYRILGRHSVDIIKTGGYKVSALEIEEVLREHPAVGEVAVVGIPDAEWGERVAAAIAPRPGADVALDALRDWASARLAKYKLPTRLVSVASLPRNAMGKVVKGEVKELFTAADSWQQTADSGSSEREMENGKRKR